MNIIKNSWAYQFNEFVYHKYLPKTLNTLFLRTILFYITRDHLYVLIYKYEL